MFAKALIFSFAAIFIAQTQSAPNHIGRNPDASIRNEADYEAARKLVEKFSDDTVNWVDNGKERLINLTDAVAKELQAAAKENKGKVGESYAVLEAELDKIKSEASSKGKDISGCLKNSEPVLVNLPTNYGQLIDTTAITKSFQGALVITASMIRVADPYDILNSVEKKFKGCTVNDEKCVADVVELIKKANASIPKEVDATVAEAVEKTGPAVETGIKEIEDYVKQGEAEGRSILDDIKKCVANKKMF